MSHAAEEQQAVGQAFRDRIAGERLHASPLARRVARQRGYSLEALSGSGPNGRIVLRDVPKLPARSRSNSLKSLKSEGADSLVRLSMEVSLQPLLALQQRIVLVRGLAGFEIADCLLKAVAIALTQDAKNSTGETGHVMIRCENYETWVPVPDAHSLSLGAIASMRSAAVAGSFGEGMLPQAQVEDLGPLGVIDAQPSLGQGIDFAFVLGAPARASLAAEVDDEGTGAAIARLNAVAGAGRDLRELARITSYVRDLLEAPLSFIP